MKKAIENAGFALRFRQPPSDKGQFYHGTKADLKMGDLFLPGGESKPSSPQNEPYLFYSDGQWSWSCGNFKNYFLLRCQ